MPNTTLCGKAVVEMLLGEEAGQKLGTLQTQLVQRGDIPSSYVLTKERIERARAAFLTVQQQDEQGVHMNGVV